MSELLRAEHRRRQSRASVALRDTEQDRFAWFLAGAKPEVLTLLHNLGRNWGGVDIDRLALARRSLVARLLGASPPGIIGRGYRVMTLAGPDCRATHYCLALGWIVREQGRCVLDYRAGLEAGGLSISIGYEDRTGGCFVLSATRPYLPAYYKTFYTLGALQAALIYEWERGTFAGTYEHYLPVHLYAERLPVAR